MYLGKWCKNPDANRSLSGVLELGILSCILVSSEFFCLILLNSSICYLLLYSTPLVGTRKYSCSCQARDNAKFLCWGRPIPIFCCSVPPFSLKRTIPFFFVIVKVIIANFSALIPKCLWGVSPHLETMALLFLLPGITHPNPRMMHANLLSVALGEKSITSHCTDWEIVYTNIVSPLPVLMDSTSLLKGNVNHTLNLLVLKSRALRSVGRTATAVITNLLTCVALWPLLKTSVESLCIDFSSFLPSLLEDPASYSGNLQEIPDLTSVPVLIFEHCLKDRNSKVEILTYELF